MLGKWDYSRVQASTPYGDDDLTYRKAMDFLADCETVEDWGCGTAYAKKFRAGKAYVGIDGSRSPFSDVVADLREYRSSPDGILMRHILEHNEEWPKVLANAVASFKQKFVLIFFTPFSPVTRNLRTNSNGVPDLSFRKDDILEFLKPFRFTEEVVRSATQYRIEHLFLITRAVAQSG